MRQRGLATRPVRADLRFAGTAADAGFGMAHRLEALGQHMRSLADMEMTMPARIAAMGMVIIMRAGFRVVDIAGRIMPRSEEHTSELQSLMRISYAVFCLKKKRQTTHPKHITI